PSLSVIIMTLTEAKSYSCFNFAPSHFLPSLLPFPTRRSSDLRRPRVCLARRCGRRRRVRSNGRAARAPPSRAPSRARGRRSNGRSEEHTSELQSPYDIECRLLLEKNDDSKYIVIERYKLAVVC